MDCTSWPLLVNISKFAYDYAQRDSTDFQMINHAMCIWNEYRNAVLGSQSHVSDL